MDQRLDKDDAALVQCIHTNTGVLGQVDTCGCEDFYVNLSVIQPGRLDPLTAHLFAAILFDWTLIQEHDCEAEESAEQTAEPELLGIRSRGVCGVYHVFTNGFEPYCPFSLLGGLL